MHITTCRVCKNKKFQQILDLGKTPLANSFIKKEQVGQSEELYPLNVVWCNKCGLMQIDEVVPPEIMFTNYLYVSGTSDALKTHFHDLVYEIMTRFNPPKNSFVIDIASNDGTLLKIFKDEGFKVLGIEPAVNLVKLAREDGIPTENDFINEKVAIKALKEWNHANIITATNVVAHINDLSELINSIDILLDPNGVLIIEVPYVVDLIENTEFDTIYHEHLSYFSLHALNVMFDIRGFKLIRAVKVAIHGGSLRIFAAKKESSYQIDSSVKKMIEAEIQQHVNQLDYYLKFAQKVEQLKKDLLELLTKLTKDGKKIFGYGASAKGNTLLNYFGISTNYIQCIADLNPLKQGYLTPGTHIPVVNPDKITMEKPDYLLLLAWNFKEEIMEQQKHIRKWGGKFINPIPKVEII